MSAASAHYGGGLVAGAYVLELFGEVATELCIRRDGDEGLLACYTDVQLVAPVLAGDVLEVTGECIRVGTRSREIVLTATVVCRRGGKKESSSTVLVEPIRAVTATATVVVPGLLPVGGRKMQPPAGRASVDG